MTHNRKSRFTAIVDDDDIEDRITSYCPDCAEYNVQSLMKERISTTDDQPIPQSDKENFIQCWNCGLILPKVHAKKESKTIPFVEPEDNIHDSGKVAIFATHNNKRSSAHTRSREIIDFIKRTRPGARRSKDYVDVDSDLRAQLQKGKQLVSYQSSNDEFQG